MNRLLTITFLLAFVGGYADATGLLVTQAFTGHITGNIVLTMIHLAQAHWGEAAATVLSVVTFTVGTIVAEWVEFGMGDAAPTRQLRLPLVIVCLLVLVAAGGRWYPGEHGNRWFIGFLALAMGFQNGALRRSGGVGVHTTFITGATTSLVTAVLKPRPGGGQEPADRAKSTATTVLGGVIAIFALGAAAGGLLQPRLGVWGISVILLPLVVALVLTFNPREALTPPDPGTAVWAAGNQPIR